MSVKISTLAMLSCMVLACGDGSVRAGAPTSPLDEPTLAAAPLDFQAQLVGTVSPPQVLVVTNTHRQKSVSLRSLSAAPPFFVESPTGPIVIPPGGSVHVLVTFRPTSPGAFSGTLLCDIARASDQVLPLNGTAIPDGTADLAATIDPETPPSTVPSTCDGVGAGSFIGCYYDDPAFTALTLTRTDTAVDFDWGTGSPDPSIGADTFSVRWRGDFVFADGTFDFRITGDDGVRLLIDAAPVLEGWRDQAATTYATTRQLSAGSHRIEVEYYDNGGEAVARLSWSPHVEVTAGSGTTYFVGTGTVGPGGCSLSQASDSSAGTSESTPFATIQHALDVAQAGDTIYVRAGTYYEDLMMRYSGDPGEPITLSGYPGERPVIDFQSTYKFGPVVRRLTLQNAQDYKLPIGWLVIQGLELVHGWDGIQTSNLHDSIIRDNVIHDSVGLGILGNGYRVTMDRNVIYHNGFDADGSETDMGSGPHGNYAVYYNGTYITLTNNVFHSNTSFGVQMAGYTFGDYDGRYLDAFAGVEYSNAKNWLVANNVFAFNGSSGIVVWSANGSAADSSFINNIFYENCLRSCSGKQGLQFYHSGSGHLVSNNIGYSTRGDVLFGYAMGDTDYLGENPAIFASENNYDATDPRLVAASAEDFRLLAGSPAIDTGKDLSGTVSTDVTGGPRPLGGGFDIGATEYGGAVSSRSSSLTSCW